MFSELGNLLEPRRRKISPRQLAAIQCVRRWRRAGLIGDDVIDTKVSLTNKEIEILYNAVSWGSDDDEDYKIASDKD